MTYTYNAPSIISPSSGTLMRAGDISVTFRHDVGTVIPAPYIVTYWVEAYDKPKGASGSTMLKRVAGSKRYSGGASEDSTITAQFPLDITDATPGARTTVYLYVTLINVAPDDYQYADYIGSSLAAERVFYAAATPQLQKPMLSNIADFRGRIEEPIAQGMVTVGWTCNDEVSGIAVIRATSKSTVVDLDKVMYVGNLYGYHTASLNVNVDDYIGANGYEDVIFQVVLRVDGWLDSSSDATRRVAKEPICELEILGTHDIGEEYGEVRDLPVTVSGRLYDYADGIGGSAKIELNVYSTRGFSVYPSWGEYYEIPERSADGSFTMQLGSDIPWRDDGFFALTLYGTNSIGLPFQAGDAAYVKFATPTSGRVDFTDNVDNGSVMVEYYPNDGGEDAIPLRGTVYAEKPNGAMKVLGNWTQDDLDARGAVTFINNYCAPNKPTRYRFEGVSGAGLRLVAENVHTIESQYFYMNWENEGSPQTVTIGQWNPEGSWSSKPANVELMRFMGRKYPVMARSAAVDETMSLTWLELEQGDADRFRSLAADIGRCYFRSPDGVACNVFIESAGAPEYTSENLYGTVTAIMTRIDGSIR